MIGSPVSWRRPARLLLLIAGMALAAPLDAAPRRTERPNVIFILADDLGYGDLGCYGQQKIKTPRLDAMAREGIRFTQCYAGSTVCAPSRAVLMTGLHTGHALIRGNGQVPLRPDDLTLAECLQRNGYVTGIVGKWGLGREGTSGTPNKKGFHEWFGFLDQHHAHQYYPEHVWKNESIYPLEGNRNGRKEQYIHDLFTREALAFVERHRAHPFFLYLAYTIPHAHTGLRSQGMEVPDDAPYSDEPWPQPERNKAAMITRLDRDVGRLLDLLKALGLDERTVVFFTSDNGPHKEGGVSPAFFKSAGPLRGIKRDLYEGGIRVPMIVRWPGVVPQNRVSEAPWAFWDVLPTLAEWTGFPAPKGIDGISVVPLLQGRRMRAHPPFYWEFHEGGFTQAARIGSWKGILKPDKPLELYDLRRDPSETQDLAEKQPKAARQLEEFIAGARTPSERWPGRKPPAAAP